MKNRQPSIRQLEYFVTVARASNYRKAAERLRISQPTLTSQIAALEEALEVQLFERSRAGTLLSSAGRELLPLARKVLEQYQALLEQAGSRGREPSGTFRMGVSPTLGPYLLPSVLPELHRRYPGLRLHVREDPPARLEAGLADASYDLILTLLPLDSSENKVRPLFLETLEVVVAADHALAEAGELRPRDLYNREVLTVAEPYLQRQIANLCEHCGAHLLKDFEGNSLDTLRQMAQMGMGIAFLPALYVSIEVGEDSGLKVKRLVGEHVTRTHVAAWRRNSPSRHLFQKISYDIKSLAMERFGEVLEEVKAEESTGSMGSE